MITISWSETIQDARFYYTKQEIVMKKFSILLVIVATLVGNVAQAQTMGKASSSAKQMANDDFNWGIGLVAVAVVATVVGLTAASAASTPNTYSN